MTVIFRPITYDDIDHLFALDEVGKFQEYLYGFDYAREAFIDRGHSIAKDEATNDYLVRMPQGDRLDSSYRYVLVSDGKIIVSKAMPTVHAFDIEYISPALTSWLDELTPFMREAFSIGGDNFFDYKRAKPLEDLMRAAGAQMNFVITNEKGEK
jgi:hypothetical protein